MAISEVYEELKERTKEVGLNISVEKKNGRKQEDEERKKWNIDSDHDREVVRSVKYLGTVISNINNETEKDQS